MNVPWPWSWLGIAGGKWPGGSLSPNEITGDCAAKPMGGNRKALLLPERSWLLARVAAAPDLTVPALHLDLADQICPSDRMLP